MLAVTLGDPYSVNIELISRVLPASMDRSVLLIGSRSQWDAQRDAMGFAAQPTTTYSGEPFTGLQFLDIDDNPYVPADQMTKRERGEIAKSSLDALRDLDCRAVLTMPIDKHAANLAGFDFPGHTEFFESLWDGRAVMLLAGERLRVGLVTNHLPISRVAEHLSADLVVEKGRSLAQTLSEVFGIREPRLAVTGLNPHAGDGGLFGDEESKYIEPAVARLQEAGIAATGPLSADTAFAFAYRGQYDAVLAMYHDQGLGPLKLVHFDDAVNISGGLQKMRVSPDHGPASDLFLMQKSNVASTAAAWRIAYEAARPV